jgi:hypothetical protein
MAVGRGTSRSTLVPFHLRFRVEPLITRSGWERTQRRSRGFKSHHLHTRSTHLQRHADASPTSPQAAIGPRLP